MSNATPRPHPVAADPAARRAFTMHGRVWQHNRYVYPVVSRRSKGISIGVNVNPDKVCNFDCIYCSVERKSPLAEWQREDVDLGVLREELGQMIDIAASGRIYGFDPFDKIPQALRRVNDIAFSGDGEPTTCPQFAEAVRVAVDVMQNSEFRIQNDLKLVLITNATMFHRPAVRDVLAFLDGHNGEVWAKLDAGTAEYYQLVDRTPVPFQRVLDNVLWCCQTRPTVIQSLFMKVHGAPPPQSEIAAYAERLADIQRQGGRIKLVQVYTVARQTTEAYATALSVEELDGIAQQLRAKLPGIAVEIFG